MQNNVFWQPVKMLCYLPHGINSTSQKKTKQQNNTPNTLLFCTVMAEDMAAEIQLSPHLQLHLLHAQARLHCQEGLHPQVAQVSQHSVPQAEPGRH